VKLFSRKRSRENERGQVVLLVAVCFTVMLLFMALAIDVGFAYVTKAKLSKAVDAACLTAMRNLAQGQTIARNLATNSFNGNYQVSSLDQVPPTVAVSFSTDSYGQTLVNVNGAATIRTFFMRMLPNYQTFSVNDSAQATRGKLVMSVVLDRSGSMASNGGSTALPPAVTTFINYFDNSNDEVAMISFASNATIDVPIGYSFITPITNAVNAMKSKFSGGTFGPGGLTDAKAQNDSVSVLPGQNTVKVVVYFTDGYVNTIQDKLSCSGTLTLYNYGGYDSGSSVDVFDPTSGTSLATYDGVSSWTPSNTCLKNVTKFTSAINGQLKSLNRTNVTADAKYRALQTATAMRTENPGMFVYSIGLGTSVDQAFLQQIANDPASSTYDPTQPVGEAVFASNCPSSQCSAQLQQVFQTIAAKILLRLTQ
jgi:Flp pilus assembly protein TadG